MRILSYKRNVERCAQFCKLCNVVWMDGENSISGKRVHVVIYWAKMKRKEVVPARAEFQDNRCTLLHIVPKSDARGWFQMVGGKMHLSLLRGPLLMISPDPK